MKGLLGREHARAAIGKRGELQRVLVGLGAAVDQEQLVVVVARDAAQALGQLHLQLVHHGVGVEAQLADLFRNLLDIVRVGVPDADHGMSAIEVQILLPFVIPYLTTFAPDDVHVEERVYVE